jgi:1,4-alpha-glucan branching enzyme
MKNSYYLSICLFYFLFMNPFETKAQMPVVRMQYVDPVQKQIRIINLGRVTENISNFKLASGNDYVVMTSGLVEIIEGDFVLAPQESVTVSWDPGVSFANSSGEMSLYGNYTPNTPLGMLHYMTYGNYAATFLEDYADPAIWTLNQTVTGTGPYYYTSVGTSLGAYQWSNLPPVDIEFRVDARYANADTMSLLCSVALSEVYPMQHTGIGSIYSVTIPVKRNSSIIYSYELLQGFIEPATAECHFEIPTTVSSYYARYYTTNTTSEVLPVVCYAQCDECDPTNDIHITYRVDMRETTVSPNGVFVYTSVDNSFATPLPMEDPDGDGIYSYTATYPGLEYQSINYIYANGNALEDIDNMVGCVVPFGLSSHRRVAPDAYDIVLPANCFGTCGYCESNQDIVDVTFKVDMSQESSNPDLDVRFYSPNLQTSSVGGEVMSDANNDNIWETTIPLEVGFPLLFRYGYIQPIIQPTDESGRNEYDLVGDCAEYNLYGFSHRSLVVPSESSVLPTVCFNECNACANTGPAPVLVTFQVNMNNESVSSNGVHVAGSFQEWNPASTALTDANGDGIYSYSVSLTPGTIVSYKFINGNDWPFSESVPNACGVGDGFGGYNRQFTVGTQNMTLPLVCFGGCTNCISTEMTSVTFRVNMQNEVVSSSGVFVAGNFQDWNPSGTLLSDLNGDGIYEATVQVLLGSELLYKFINGGTWQGAESVPSACGVGDGLGGFNRSGVATMNSMLPLVCFSACTNCEDPSLTAVTFRVDMQNESISPDGVFVAGNFQNWVASASEMTDTNNDGVYEATLQVPIGFELMYKFINGGVWSGVEGVPAECGVGDGLGGYNRVATVSSNQVLPLVCFGQCGACTSENVTLVTFKVDMQNEVVSSDGVHVAGNFQDWNPSGSEMLDTNGDGVFEFSVELPIGYELLYKFINGNSWSGVESVPALCGVGDGVGGYNRNATVVANSSISEVCFSSCSDCEISEPTVQLQLQVNMQGTTVSPNGVHVAGTFNGDSPSSTLMSDVDGDFIYTALVQVPANSTVRYVFVNGNISAQAELVPSACAVNAKRQIQVGTVNTEAPVVCFASCSDCEQIQPTVTVTFLLDASTISPSAQGVYVAGNFQSWTLGTSEMIDSDGDGVFEFEAVVDANSSLLFKFVNGATWAGQEVVPSECGVGDGFGGFNRTFDVGTVNTTYGPVCFSSCVACPEPEPVVITFTVDMSDETVSPAGIHLAGSFNNWSATANPMTSLGAGLYRAQVSVAPQTEIRFKYLNGNDFANAEGVPSNCGVGDGFGGYNRVYQVTQNPATLPVVCFGACSSCVSNVEEVSPVDMIIYPNPAEDVVLVTGLTQNAELFVFDATGKVCALQAKRIGDVWNIDTALLSPGVYIVRDVISNSSRRLVKQ